VALALEIETTRLDRVSVEVLVVPFFACDRPLRGPAARADWRLCGILSDRLERGDLTGEPGEAALLATGGRMRSPLLLAIGLGPRAEFGEETLRAVARTATRKLIGLRSGIAGLGLPAESVSRLDAQRAAGLILEGVAQALSERPSALRLHVVASQDEAGRVRAGLLETANRISGPELAVRLDHPRGDVLHRRGAATPTSRSPAGIRVPGIDSRR
jgi:hypothetical protein